VSVTKLIERHVEHDGRYPHGDGRCGCIPCRTFGLSPDSVAYTEELRLSVKQAFIDMLDMLKENSVGLASHSNEWNTTNQVIDNMLEELRR
jgi:hypothetical protein